MLLRLFEVLKKLFIFKVTQTAWDNQFGKVLPSLN